MGGHINVNIWGILRHIAIVEAGPAAPEAPQVCTMGDRCLLLCAGGPPPGPRAARSAPPTQLRGPAPATARRRARGRALVLALVAWGPAAARPAHLKHLAVGQEARVLLQAAVCVGGRCVVGQAGCVRPGGCFGARCSSGARSRQRTALFATSAALGLTSSWWSGSRGSGRGLGPAGHLGHRRRCPREGARAACALCRALRCAARLATPRSKARRAA